MSRLRFARWIFLLAGIIGLVIVVPPFFQEDQFGRDYPPEITHPEFFYGFLTAVLAWQLMYITIGTDPLRFRARCCRRFSQRRAMPSQFCSCIRQKEYIRCRSASPPWTPRSRFSLSSRTSRRGRLRRTSLASRVTCGALPIRAIGVIRGSTSLYGQLVSNAPFPAEIIDPTCERPPNAPRILLRPRGEPQATSRTTVESGETAVGGGVERPHRTDVVDDSANASKVPSHVHSRTCVALRRVV